MSLNTILAQIADFITFAIPASAGISLVCFCIHKFILKKDTPFWKLLSGFLLFAMVAFILYLTYFTRSEAVGHSYDLHLFRSYREAWNSFSLRDWQLVIFNIALFMPVGFLLPTTMEVFRKGYRTTLMGFLFSLGIESTQYILKLGLCELDDLVNNTLGIILGYCVFRILFTFFDDQRFRILKMLVSFIPIIATVGMFCYMNYSYSKQELGNLPINYTYKVDLSKSEVTVDDDVKLNETQEQTNIYRPASYTKSQAETFAKNLLSNMGCTGKVKSTYDDEHTITVYSGARSVEVCMLDRCFVYTYDPLDQDLQSGDMGIQTVKAKLESCGIEIPDNADLTKPDTGVYLWTVQRTNETAEDISGTIECDTTSNGVITSIKYNMMRFTSEKEVTMISEQYALSLLEKGYFYWDITENQIKTLNVTGADLTYSQDTKGYYQPVYLFHCEINGEKRDLVIPALLQVELSDILEEIIKR